MKSGSKRKIDWNEFSTFIFDLDGTVWRWDRLIPGAKETIVALQKRKKQVLFITNNTILSRKKLWGKLWRLGIDLGEDQLINAGLVAAGYFKQKTGIKMKVKTKSGKRQRKKDEQCMRKSVLAISRGLREDLEERGVSTTNKATADYVIVGHDIRFDYMTLFTAMEALRRGAKLYATAAGRYFVAGNELWPGTGVLVEALEYASGKKARLLGKPSAQMCDAIRAANKSKPNKTVLVGDEIMADIAAGKSLGYFTVLVKTGVDKGTKSTEKTMSKVRGKEGKIKPDLIVKSIADISPEIKK